MRTKTTWINRQNDVGKFVPWFPRFCVACRDKVSFEPMYWRKFQLTHYAGGSDYYYHICLRCEDDPKKAYERIYEEASVKITLKDGTVIRSV